MRACSLQTRISACRSSCCTRDFNISDGGMLLRIAASSSKPGVITAQAVVPVTLRAVVMQAAHDDATALHAGIAATQMRIMEKYWWHTMQYTGCRCANVCQQLSSLPKAEV